MAEKVYAVVRFRTEYVQTCRNSLISHVSIMRNYKGSVAGIAENVESVEGDWEGKQSLAVLEFASLRDAEMWYLHTPDVKQPDWINGVDIIFVPLKGTAPRDKPWVQLMDVSLRDQARYVDQCLPAEGASVKAAGGAALVASTSQASKIRGLWEPASYLVINQWESKEAFFNWYNTKESQQARAERQETADVNMLLFKLENLKTEHDSYCLGRKQDK